jgi:type IV secretory pathway VirB10-like protein
MSPAKPTTPSMEGPSGINLSPTPPNPARLSKRAGLLFLAVVVAVVGMIIYGMYQRSQRRFGAENHTDTRNMTAATAAESQILSLVPERAISNGAGTQQTEELKPPGETKSASTGTASASGQVRSIPSTSPVTAAPSDLSPEERRRAELYQQELAALAAPTRTGGDASLNQMASGTAPTQGSDGGNVGALLQSLQPPNATTATLGTAGAAASGLGLPRGLLGGGSYSPSEEYQLQNMQDQKSAFLAGSRTKATEDYLATARVPPITNFVIRAGWDIPAVLEQGINSDLPGETRALVREDVYDSASGKFLRFRKDRVWWGTTTHRSPTARADSRLSGSASYFRTPLPSTWMV